jgi:hypothetical protein
MFIIIYDRYTPYLNTIQVYIDVYRYEIRRCEFTTDQSTQTEPHLVQQAAGLGTRGVTLGDSICRYTWAHLGELNR